MADNGRCYLCSKTTPFVSVQVDHLIPKRLKPADFNDIWERLGGDLPNLGPHHISNLRAICSDCNSSRVKGASTLAEGYLAAQLTNSARISKLAFAVQSRMRRDRAVGESAVKVTSAADDEDFRVLWEEGLSQALMGTLHMAAQAIEPSSGAESLVMAGETAVILRTSMSPDAARLMGAVQLVSGVPLVRITESLIPDAVEVVAERHREFAESTFPDLRGANSGTTDWSTATFIVTWESATIDEQICVCRASVALDGEVTAPVSLQSENGDELIDISGPECVVDGYAFFEVTVGVGDGVYNVALQDESLAPSRKDSQPA
ncbi:hypothetical protein GCM10009587_11720 [Microbacterium maritypicum]